MVTASEFPPLPLTGWKLGGSGQPPCGSTLHWLGRDGNQGGSSRLRSVQLCAAAGVLLHCRLRSRRLGPSDCASPWGLPPQLRAQTLWWVPLAGSGWILTAQLDRPGCLREPAVPPELGAGTRTVHHWSREQPLCWPAAGTGVVGTPRVAAGAVDAFASQEVSCIAPRSCFPSLGKGRAAKVRGLPGSGSPGRCGRCRFPSPLPRFRAAQTGRWVGIRKWHGGGVDGDGKDLPFIEAWLAPLWCPSLTVSTSNRLDPESGVQG